MFPVVPTISESSGIPKEKNCPQPSAIKLRPLFTGQVFIVAEGLPRGDSGGATGSGLALVFTLGGVALALRS